MRTSKRPGHHFTAAIAVSAAVIGSASVLAGWAALIPTVVSASYIYVADQRGNLLTIDETENTLATTIPLSGIPFGVVVAPGGLHVYVTLQNKNTVAVVSTASKNVIATIPVGASPTREAISGDGQVLYVLDSGSNSVSVISTATNKVLRTITVGQGPADLVVTPDGKRVMVSSLYSANISVINTASNSVADTWRMPGGVAAIVASADGTALYAIAPSANVVFVLNAMSGAVTRSIGGFLYPNSMALSPDGSRLYVTNGNRKSLAYVDTTTSKVLAEIGVGALPTSVVLSSDGSKAYVANMIGDSVSVVSTHANAVVKTILKVGIPASLGTAAAQPISGQQPPQPMVTPGGPTCAQASTGLPSLPSAVVLPTLPQVCNVPIYPVPTAGTLAVHTAVDLQNALNAATCGQEIVLDAGVSYVGNFWMPGKSCSGSILVRSAAIQNLTPNVVPTWAQRQYMARVSTPNALQVLLDAFTHDGSAAGTGVTWYWAGIELTAEPGVTFWDLIQFGGAEPPYPTPDQILYGITFDRCFVHGNDQMSARGFAAEAAGFALINSRVWDFNNSYQDTQTVGACNGPGPYLISNNVLESTGENVMFGGCSAISVPSDITVTRNHFLKDLSWNGWIPPNATQQYDVKNEFEIKNGQRVLVDSNYFENTFGEAQNEFTIINCGVNEGLQTCFDITYTNNVFAHGPQVFVFGGNASYLTEQRVLFRNNLAYDINGTHYTGPGMFGRLAATKNSTIDHNTCINQPSNNYMNGLSFADDLPSSDIGLTYTNNIIYASMTANGMDPLQVLQDLPSDANVSYDVFVGDAWPDSYMGAYPPQDHLWSPNSTATPVSNQPSCNQLNKPIVQCWPLDLALVGFAGPDTNGKLTLSGLALAPLSQYYRAASDGTDVGANIPAVLAAVANVPH